LDFAELVENWYVAAFGLGMLVGLLSPTLAVLTALVLAALIVIEMNKKEKKQKKKK